VSTSNGDKEADKNTVDYMDQEMSEADERSKQRLAIIFREFKNEIESYGSAGNDKGKSEKGMFRILECSYFLNWSKH